MGLSAFLRDVRYSLRSLGRTPALTAALLATVAVGIGTHATATGFVNGLLTRNLGVPDAERLAAIHWRDASGAYAPVPYEQYVGLAKRPSSTLESVAAVRESRVSVTLRERTGWMSVAAASANLWDVLRVPAAAGRVSFAAVQGDDRVPVVLAHHVWIDQFAGSGEAIGAEVAVGGRPAVVAGVVPEWFDGLYLGRRVDVWVPFADAPAGPHAAGVWLIARVRQGGTIEAAQKELTSAGDAREGLVVMRHTGVEPDVQARLARVKELLGWAAALVFVTAAANVAGFLLSRAARRAHETAARVALGATRAHLVSQIVADSLIVTAGGGALGAFVAFWSASAFPALIYAEDAARLRLMPDPWRVVGSVAAYATVMLLCALAPLAQITQHGAMAVLRRSEGTSSTGAGWLRSVLVMAQMGVCVVLVIATALLFEGFRQALRTVRAENLGQPVVAVVEAAARYANPSAGQDYFRRIEDEAARVPGVTGTAWVGSLPGGHPPGLSVRLEQRPIASRTVLMPAATPPGALLAGLVPKQGRAFGGGDGPFSCRVAIVNEPAASDLLDGHAVGTSIRDGSGRRVDIVGVVAPSKPGARVPGPLIYFYERQALAAPPPGITLEPFALPVAPASPPPADVEVEINVASSGYFEAIGATFVAGRGFDADAVSGGCDVAVVNREASQLYFGGEAVGGAVIDAEGRRAEIVGVVDAGVLHVMQRRAAPMVFFPAEQRYIYRMALIAGTRGASADLRGAIAQRLRGVSGGELRGSVITLEEHLARTSLGPERVATVLVAACAAVALGLGLLGAYGVMSDSVRQKKREIALRLALGAQAWKIVYDVFRGGVRVAAAGTVAGLVAAAGLVAFVRHANPDFAAPVLWMWLASPAALLIIVVIATVLPARWALAVDPLTITRES